MNWDTVASLATAIGVGVAAWQIWESRKLSQIAFEDSLDQQYRSLAMQIPVDALIGKNIPDNKKSDVREIIYNYLDLCNEQAYLRKKKRVSKLRWNEWNDGIKSNLCKPVFKEVWEEVKREVPSEFTALTILEDGGFNGDPAKWERKKA